jgi:pectate lyase
MLLVALTIAATALPAVPAFPGAEGAGAMARGGRGGRVIRVTSLADGGPGSLREAIEAEGPRTIIFDIGGTIRLGKPLVVRNGQITLAGQTAPGDGITLRDHHFEIAASDVIVRYIRARLGDQSKVEADSFTISRGQRIIVDHVSASWSIDETLSAGSDYEQPEDDLRDITVQWSIISESLRKSLHAKGEHGYGSLLRGARGARMSFHHNLWAHHSARMPRPGNYLIPQQDPVGALYDFRSNLFYNWGGSYAGYNADSGEKASLAAYNFVDNYYKTGPNSKKPIAFDERNPLAKAWFSGNAMNGTVPADQWSLVSGRSDHSFRLAAPLPFPPIRRDPALAAYEKVLAGAGASLVRDSVDARVVETVRSAGGKLIDSQAGVGGWPRLSSGRPWRDSDGDGMPDQWERRNGFNARKADANDDKDRDGYTNLEEWLNSLIPPPVGEPGTLAEQNTTGNRATGTAALFAWTRTHRGCRR